jgi:fructan beta-fructosidase
LPNKTNPMRATFLFLAMAAALAAAAQDSSLYREPFRPRYHFSAARNWINDPNGLVYAEGVYHLFYQHNPLGNVWGHMSWGHAESRDLLHWSHQPVAIPEQGEVMAFSGTCITDTRNSSGFGKKGGPPPMVAMYTGHIENRNQSQYLAYSLDRGRTWTQYEGNPVLDLHKKDFRDPNIFWDGPRGRWLLSLVLPLEHQVQFYASANLKNWTLLSSFGPAGDTSGVWECPGLLQVPVAGSPGQSRWVLMLSMNASMQYFVGDFDGTRFSSISKPGEILRPDWGPDYYAAICYNQLPAGQAPLAIGWVNNWYYANAIPTRPWKGAMSLPRRLSLRQSGDSWVLIQEPIAALAGLRGPGLGWTDQWLAELEALPRRSRQFELDLVIEPGKNSVCGVRVAADGDHYLEIGYDQERGMLFLDRKSAGHPPIEAAAFDQKNRFETPLKTKNGRVSLRVFVDHSIVEVFANQGEKVMTAQCFAPESSDQIQLFSSGAGSFVRRLRYYPMASVWKE